MRRGWIGLVMGVWLGGLLAPAWAQDAREGALRLVAAESAKASAEPVTLPVWSPPEPKGPAVPFVLDTAQPRADIWGSGRAYPMHFFDESLPGLFERTLVLHEGVPAGGKLQWIFTGEEGGLTVTVSEALLEVSQRFYGSTGLGLIARARPAKHPEYVTSRRRIPLAGTLQAVSVTMDHRLQLRVAANGREVFRELWPIDVSRHQLRLEADSGAVRGECLAPPGRSCKVSVDPAVRRQTMLGFGGIAAPTAFARLSEEGKRRWWETLCEYNLLIQREYPIGTRLNRQADNWERLSDATPHYYGDNFPNGEISDFDYIRRLRQLGGKVWFEFWALPPWTRQEWKDPAGKVRRGVVDPQQYVRAMLAYCRASKERAGAPPDVVGIQNEIHQPTPLWFEMAHALRKGLDEAGFQDVRIHMSDCGHLGGGIAWAKELRGAPEVWSTLDYAAVHMYDYQSCFTDPDRFDQKLRQWKETVGGKPFLSTELCVNSSDYQWKSYRLAFSMGQLYHKNLVLADAEAICYCWTLLDVVQPSYGWTRSLFVPEAADGFVPKPSSYQLRVFGALSRRVREGMVRVEARCEDPDLLACALVGPDGRKTVILMNRSTSPCSVDLRHGDAELTDVELVDPYHQNAILSPAAVAPQGRVRLDPGSILTLTNVPKGRLPAAP